VPRYSGDESLSRSQLVCRQITVVVGCYSLFELCVSTVLPLKLSGCYIKLSTIVGYCKLLSAANNEEMLLLNDFINAKVD